MVRDESEGFLRILGGLVLNLGRNHDALNSECGARDRLWPRQVSQDPLNVVISEVLLDNRAQVLLASIPTGAQLSRDVGGQVRIRQQ
jgi:hypothetical protein